MPLMTPAAKIGIQTICTAQIVMPMKPNSTKLMTSSTTMPRTREAAVEVALDPVVGRAVAVALERLAVLRFLAIELGAFQHDLADAVDLRAVRIVDGLALRVVLAMDRGPLLGHHAGGEPQPETEEMAGDRMQVERAMRLMAVQINRDRRRS